MKTKTLRILTLAGFALCTLAAGAPASARDGHRHYGHARPFHHAPHAVIVYRPAPVYYAPAPLYYTYYPAPAPVYYQPQPAWGAIGGAIAGAAIGSTIGRGNGRIASIAAGSVIGAAVGSQLTAH